MAMMTARSERSRILGCSRGWDGYERVRDQAIEATMALAILGLSAGLLLRPSDPAAWRRDEGLLLVLSGVVFVLSRARKWLGPRAPG